MKKIVGIQFKGGGKVYYFDPLDYEFDNGEYAIVETVRGLELGFVKIKNRLVEDEQVAYDLKPVIKKASQSDLDREKKNEKLASLAFEIFKRHVNSLNLEMKPLYAEYTIDQSKIVFYYTADERVDFRELLKLLTPEFKTRVELRQIGPREAARYIGGIGSCGRTLCCCTHLLNFDFVTMKMAKEQGMSLNTNKISGQCGKLMCCIGYEHELYKELKKELPQIGDFVKTPSCDYCKVVQVDYLKGLVKTEEKKDGLVIHEASDVEELIFATNDDAKKLDDAGIDLLPSAKKEVKLNKKPKNDSSLRKDKPNIKQKTNQVLPKDKSNTKQKSNVVNKNIKNKAPIKKGKNSSDKED